MANLDNGNTENATLLEEKAAVCILRRKKKQERKRKKEREREREGEETKGRKKEKGKVLNKTGWLWDYGFLRAQGNLL